MQARVPFFQIVECLGKKTNKLSACYNIVNAPIFQIMKAKKKKKNPGMDFCFYKIR